MVILATRSTWASPTPALISRQVALELRLGLNQGIEPGKPGCTSASGNPRQIARISEVTSQSQQKLASLMVCQAKHYSSWWEAVMPAQGSWWFGQKQRRPLSSQLQPKPTASILQSYKDHFCTFEKKEVQLMTYLLQNCFCGDLERRCTFWKGKTIISNKTRLTPALDNPRKHLEKT